jgi:hypothetical protein
MAFTGSPGGDCHQDWANWANKANLEEAGTSDSVL